MSTARYAFVKANWHSDIVDRALEGFRAEIGDAEVEVFDVPGAFEIPLAAKKAAGTGQFAAVICLGCLIRGATAHFEYIASACAHGIADAASATGVPMTFGVLTTNSVEEALERAGEGPSNKGWEAAIAAVEMATLRFKI